ncbi:hypothetical protein F5Y15DRAFT_361826 [Xylariaceae sp. FL0016]|nr:hypothetical protein F5Y15DRAFT_361826 [Xylariaceae sp. FL0016]
MMAPEVQLEVYTTPPQALVRLLRTHVPYSLPLLRRLAFTGFPGGITEHARIMWASSAPLDAGAADAARFAAGYLDLSRGPETELWLYSSAERGGGDDDDDGDGDGDGDDDAEGECAAYGVALLAEVRRRRAAYLAGGHAREEAETVLVGSLSERTRGMLVRAGMVFPYAEVYDKWVFRVEDLPDVASPLREGMRWDVVRRGDIGLVLGRTHIQRKERTVKLLRSTAIYLEDGTPIAWSFLGPDSSLSSLHCEEPFRGKGLAKAVAVKLLRDHLKDYDDEGYGWADVAPDNPQSQGVCKSCELP